MVPGFVTNFSYNPKCCKNLEAFETFLLLMKSSYWLKVVEESNQIPLFLKSDIQFLCIEIDFNRNVSRQRNTPNHKTLTDKEIHLSTSSSFIYFIRS